MDIDSSSWVSQKAWFLSFWWFPVVSCIEKLLETKLTNYWCIVWSRKYPTLAPLEFRAIQQPQHIVMYFLEWLEYIEVCLERALSLLASVYHQYFLFIYFNYSFTPFSWFLLPLYFILIYIYAWVWTSLSRFLLLRLRVSPSDISFLYSFTYSYHYCRYIYLR